MKDLMDAIVRGFRNTGIPETASIVAGFGVAAFLGWLVFRYVDDEDRLKFWMVGCGAVGVVACVLMYKYMMAHDACRLWFERC